MNNKNILVLIRLSMAWIMLWAFMDKLWGLGFGTTVANSWLQGHSPTSGFLKSSAGPLAGVFQGMVGNPIVDWLFMLGLLLIGLALLLGIGVRIAGGAGALMMLLMWASHFPPSQNPLIDDHIIYLLIFILLAKNAEGIGRIGIWWAGQKLVKKYPILK
ncbi:hypothetical protein IT411_01435 [Candidatus Peregrinibacteria bacterium]|nr:hypothetical protein [Candidatus Peregrinibacteria bacterium]